HGDAALDYAHRGYPVLPCVAHGKQPITEHGLKDASTDEHTVRGWSRKWPMANVAIRTGDRFDVLDVDDLDALAELVGGDDTIISCGPCVNTPGGGAHLYFEPTGLGNRAKFTPGCDWRGKGGYIIAPPSRIGEASYRWHEEAGETFDLDRPLVPVPG